MINVLEKVNQNEGIKSDNGSQESPLGHGKNGRGINDGME